MNQYRPIKVHHKTNKKNRGSTASKSTPKTNEIQQRPVINLPEIKIRTPAKNTQVTKFLGGETEEENRGCCHKAADHFTVNFSVNIRKRVGASVCQQKEPRGKKSFIAFN